MPIKRQGKTTYREKIMVKAKEIEDARLAEKSARHNQRIIDIDDGKCDHLGPKSCGFDLRRQSQRIIENNGVGC